MPPSETLPHPLVQQFRNLGLGVGVIIDAPDVDQLQQMLQSPAGAEAMALEGVRAETVLVLVQA